MIFNLPYVGQRLKLSNGRLIPSLSGQYTLIAFYGDRKVIVRRGEKELMFAMILRSGYLTIRHLRFAPHYVELAVGFFVPSNRRNSTTTISGKYPDYFTDDGRRVWMLNASEAWDYRHFSTEDEDGF